MNVFDILREKLETKKANCIHNQNKFGNQNLCESTLIREAMKYAFKSAIKSVDEVERQYNNGWIPADKPPKEDEFVLLSFTNFSALLVGRYEEDENGNGAFYAGDEDVSLVSQDMIVNAWMPLPPKYED